MENELNKMTAVDWFIEQLEQKGDASENVGIRKIQISIDVSDYLDLKRQAFQMEKEQMCKFVYKCHNHYKVNGGFKIEEYYAEKYGKKTFLDLVSDEESQVHEVVRKLKEKLKEGNK
jgi:hypothetical protein